MERSTPRNARRWGCALAVSALTLSLSAWADEGLRLQPVAPNPRQVSTIGGEGSWAVSFTVNSLLPLSSPFQSVSSSGATQDFRFQTATTFNLELGYQLTPQWELAVSAGYEGFLSRSQYAASLDQFEQASVQQYPIELVVRYRFNTQGWTPEAEAGAGMSFGSIDVTSTNASFSQLSTNLSALKMHAAFGAAFPWTDSASIHIKAGYGIETWGSKVLVQAGNTEGVQQASLSGVFAGAQIRYAF